MKKIDVTQPRTCKNCGVFKQPEEFKKPGVCLECVKLRARARVERITGRKVCPVYPWVGDYRKCSKCEQMKHRDEYGRQSKGHGEWRYFAHCKDCHNAKQRERYADNPVVREKLKSGAIEYYGDNKTLIRSDRILKEYGITLNDKHRMIEENEGKCPICGSDDPGRYWAIDHCHKTGLVRGVLCNACNKGLGFFKDNVASLYKSIWYLLTSGRAEESAVCIEGVPKPEEEYEMEEP